MTRLSDEELRQQIIHAIKCHAYLSNDTNAMLAERIADIYKADREAILAERDAMQEERDRWLAPMHDLMVAYDRSTDVQRRQLMAVIARQRDESWRHANKLIAELAACRAELAEAKRCVGVKCEYCDSPATAIQEGHFTCEQCSP